MRDTEPRSQQESPDFIPQAKGNRSFGSLVRDLSHEALKLVRQEAELAKVEMSQNAANALRDTVLLFVGGAVAFAGLLALMTAVIFALTQFMSLGWASLLVGIVAVVTGSVTLWVGKQRIRKRDLQPRRTIEGLQKDKEWINRQLS